MLIVIMKVVVLVFLTVQLFSVASGQGTSANIVAGACYGGTYYNSDDGACIACPHHTYADGTTSATKYEEGCTRCPAGKYAYQGYATSADDCGTNCGPGFINKKIQDIPGWYDGSAFGRSSIILQDQNFTCSPCLAGTYKPTGDNNCTTCPAGKHNDNDLSSVYYQSYLNGGSSYTYSYPITPHTECNNCKAGTYSQSSTTACTTCSSGYSAAGSSACSSICPAGSVDSAEYLGSITGGQSSVSTTGCYPCKPGSYAEAAGLSVCTACPLGSYSMTYSSTGCDSCAYPEGAYVSYAEGPFAPFVDSQYYENSVYSTGTSMSSPSTYPTSYSATYKYLGWGFSVNAYSESITSLSKGFSFEPYGHSEYTFRSYSKHPSLSAYYYTYNAAEVSKLPATTCKACSSGRYWEAGLCKQCPTGKYSSSAGAQGSGSCKQCDIGKTTSSAASYVVSTSEYNCTSTDLYQYADSTLAKTFDTSLKTCFVANVTSDLTSGTTCDKICRWPFRRSFNAKATVYRECGTLSSIFSLDTPLGVIIAVCLVPVFMFFFCLSLIKDNGVRNMRLTLALGVYFLIPAVDVVSDLLYIQANAFYHLGFFIAIASFHLQPAITLVGMMFHRGWIPKFRIVPIPGFIFYEEYTKPKHYIITGLLMTPFILLNSPVLLPLFIIGVYLFSCKVFSINSVAEVWYKLWTGKDDWHRKDVISLETLNESLYAQIAFETLPQFSTQIANNILLDNYNAVSTFSTCISGLNLMNGLYRMVYYKLYKRIKITQIPLKLAIAGVQILKTDDVFKSRPTSRHLSLRQSISIRKKLVDSQLENDEIDINKESFHDVVKGGIEMVKVDVVVEGASEESGLNEEVVTTDKEQVITDAMSVPYIESSEDVQGGLDKEEIDAVKSPFGDIDIADIFEEEEEYLNVKSASQEKVNFKFEMDFVKIDENIAKLRHALLPVKKYAYKQFADHAEIDKIINLDKKKV